MLSFEGDGASTEEDQPKISHCSIYYRHSNNILVHKNGSVVHIDFGIVFEQGKLLLVPEKVPFRLTRNIIDGFGPPGTQGRFTVVAIETLKALKQNASSLLTILSAVVNDPLYKWQMANNPKFERERQNLLRRVSESGSNRRGSRTPKADPNSNETAQQAVSKCRLKLMGYEDGTAGEQQSTEGQVQFLINTATDISLLSQM